MIKNWSNKIKEQVSKDKPVVFLLGLDDIDFSLLEDAYVVYIGHHGDSGAQIADLILPSTAFPEKSSTFVNMEGRVIQTTKCFHPIGDAKDEWKIFRSLSNEINKDLKFNNLAELRVEILNNYEIFKELNIIPNSKIFNLQSSKQIESKNIEFNINTFI